MSKPQPELPERLQASGATDLERRLLDAGSREQPSHELSERMARAIGVAFSAPAGMASSGVKTGTTAGSASSASGSLVPWVSGALVAACVVAGAYIATRPSQKSPVASAVAAPVPSVSSAPSAPETPTAELVAPEPAASAADDAPARTPAPLHGRRGTPARELANQIALVDAARRALAAGDARRALSSAREYQTEYPKGTFRPEVAAVKIEALIKIGRTAEARSLAERFVVTYGPGPLADRVARLAHLTEP